MRTVARFFQNVRKVARFFQFSVLFREFSDEISQKFGDVWKFPPFASRFVRVLPAHRFGRESIDVLVWLYCVGGKVR